ncbi:unnamed protein product [Anisakis simplex]|uniref:MutL_C domain-containing protein n=1 Tax=Anisakis simplex TaxID=6269 RepID=A0A0M3K6A9_ANISI|nr:unnamed protein product [Anisakis simplex]
MRHHQDHPSITKQSDKLIEYPVFNVTSQQKAEEELDAKLEKDDFASMNIIGQFNKGFIITQLYNDLFIVDQHASDEKFNFERLQSKARIQSQLLISPRVLNIGAMEEAILRDNIDIFNCNGYEFRYDEEDIHEMLSVLKQYPGIMYRPTKVHKLFASRACRTSVMIGTSLSSAQMQKVSLLFTVPLR